MSYSMPINERFNAPSLRKLALTVEEAGPGQFRWRILEGHGMALDAPEFAPISSADLNSSTYDNALAAGYGALQRLIGHDLQFGPRVEPDFSSIRALGSGNRPDAGTEFTGSRER